MLGDAPKGCLLMATPDPTLWPRDPHTEAKHLVLGGYYDAWFPIMLQAPYFSSLTVFEGYSGPGEYDQGEEGSPIVAMRSLLERPELVRLGKPVRFAFLEDRQDRVEHLRGLIASIFGTLPPHVTCEVRRGRCETDGIGLLTDIGAWGHPIFANLDPFDAHVPLAIVQRLAANDASEAFVTFMSGRLVRFATKTDLPQGDEMFGSSDWRQVSTLPTEEKEAFLVERYRQTLVGAGLGKVAGFKLIDEGGRAFWLLYATRHVRGLERMKSAMWKVDPIRGFRFRDPRDTQQGMLDMQWQPDLKPLRQTLLDRLHEVGKVSVDTLRTFTLEETPYRETHTADAVRRLVTDKVIGRDPERGPLTKETLVWPIGAMTESLF